MKHHSDETQRLEVKQYFEEIKKYAQSIPEKRYPHQNRYIALLHLLSDSISSLTRKRMEDESEPAACEKGCDACCYFAVITVSRSELDEIRHYLNAKQDEEVGVILKRQPRKVHPCSPVPFCYRSKAVVRFIRSVPWLADFCFHPGNVQGRMKVPENFNPAKNLPGWAGRKCHCGRTPF